MTVLFDQAIYAVPRLSSKQQDFIAQDILAGVDTSIRSRAALAEARSDDVLEGLVERALTDLANSGAFYRTMPQRIR